MESNAFRKSIKQAKVHLPMDFLPSRMVFRVKIRDIRLLLDRADSISSLVMGSLGSFKKEFSKSLITGVKQEAGDSLQS